MLHSTFLRPDDLSYIDVNVMTSHSITSEMIIRPNHRMSVVGSCCVTAARHKLERVLFHSTRIARLENRKLHVWQAIKRCARSVVWKASVSQATNRLVYRTGKYSNILCPNRSFIQRDQRENISCAVVFFSLTAEVRTELSSVRIHFLPLIKFWQKFIKSNELANERCLGR